MSEHKTILEIGKKSLKHHPLDLSHLWSEPLQLSTIAGVGFVVAGAIFELPLLIGAGLAAIGIKDGYTE